ncbi:MAG: D-xylose ABC transporter ATP-binding protein [Bacteroidetes bacterium RBG_13_42_15]|nr:MAG: D-xylose ABC transporter ATP-binding protein [Bacteroidetes bacterium RBG_13_42_15]HJX72289.1 sugar ABC transporter ATP-binding protein [Bacteroidales bacterium]
MTANRNNGVVLEAVNITKTFTGVTALNNVSLNIYSDEVNAIVGENGAGKSTLMNIFSGVYSDYEGKMLLDGEEVRFANPKQAQQKGISIIHQELNLVPNLSIAENIFLGREFINRFGLLDYQKIYKETDKLMSVLELDVSTRTKINKLKVGQQQIVEIAKALSFDARIIIMDEPTSAISKHETEVLFRLIESLKKKGVAIIYITHKLEELERIAEKIIVLRDGKFIHSGPLKNISRNEIIRMMVGREIRDFFVRDRSETGMEILRIEGLSLRDPFIPGGYALRKISFSLKQGEVLGIFGLMGAGRTELLESIFGLYPEQVEGKIIIEGKFTVVNNPLAGKRFGLALVPEDRKLDGLILQMTVCESISLASIENVENYGFINHGREKKQAGNFIHDLQIKTTSALQVVEKLSGGNQQKVVIAKWLATNPKILLLDEPTRGIDVNAKNEIYKLIGKLAKQGIGIIMVSSELPEILAMSDRIVVMSEGRITAEFSQGQANEENIMQAALPKSTMAGENT